MKINVHTNISESHGDDIEVIINVDDIMYVYSEEQNNYCKTQKGVFKIKEKLYEL